MFTATRHGLETPQRVRQFFVQQQLEDLIPSQDPVALEDPVPLGDNGEELGDIDGRQKDLPAFLKNRSLRRRLDDAFESCYESSLGHWIRGIFRS